MMLKVAPSEKQSRQISILLTIAALLLWCHSIVYAKLEIGYFGLIHGLPATFLIALAFLTVASAILWVSKENHGKLLCLQLLLLISALWLIPAVTGGSPPGIDHAYRNLGYADYIIRQGHFDSAKMGYLSWPGIFIMLATARNIGGVNLEPLQCVFPLFMQLLYLLPLYVFLRNTLGEARRNYCWGGCCIFYLAQWVRGGYLGTQGIALFLLLTLLALATSSSFWERNRKSFAFLALSLLVFAGLAITHLLTSIVALCIVIGLCLVRRSKRVALVAVLCFLMMVCWDFIGAQHFIISQISSQPLVTTSAKPDTTSAKPTSIITLDPDFITESQVATHVAGSSSHIAVVKIRVLLSAIFALIGLIGAVCTSLVKRKDALPILAIALAPLVLIVLSGHYGGGMLQRLYLFSLAPLAYFGASLLHMKSKMPVIVLCLLLIVACPLHVIAHYGNQELDYFSASQTAGVHFFQSNIGHGDITGVLPEVLAITKNIECYRHGFLKWLSFENDMLIPEEQRGQDFPWYIGISRQDRAWHKFFLGDAEFIPEIEQSLDNAKNCDFIYTNPDIKLYIYVSK